MKRASLALGLALLLVLLLFIGAPKSSAASDCEPSGLGTICTNLVLNDIVVTVAGREIARFPAPVKTVSVKVPVPGPTQLVPGPIRTIVVPSPVPGPVRTVYVTSPGPVRNSPVPAPTRSVAGPVMPKLTPTPGSATVSPVPSPVVTTKPGKTVVKFKDRTVKFTVPQAIAISAGFVLLGLLAGLALLYITYRTGEKDGEKIAAKRGHDLLHDLFGKD